MTLPVACSRGSGIIWSARRVDETASDLLGTVLVSLETDLINSDIMSDQGLYKL